MAAERRLAAIMFTDIVGFAAAMASSEELGRRLRKRHFETVRPVVDRYGGHWIEGTGDETLSIFTSAVDAVNCALAIQGALEDDEELSLRIGLHHGDVRVEAGQVIGDAVHFASRIRPLATARGIAVSEPVQREVRNQANVQSRSLGVHDLKHVGPIEVFAVSGVADPPTAGRVGARVRALAGPVAAVVALAAVAVVIWWWLTQPDLTTLAVLPLENLSGDPEQEYFADGMTIEFISELTKNPALRVTSWSTVRLFKNGRKPLDEIANEINVDFIVEGTILRLGDRLRLTLNLVEARRDRNLWGDNWERVQQEVPALKGEIGVAIAKALGVDSSTPARERPPIDADALDAYLRGIQHMARDSPEDLEAAIESFQEATRIDPGYAQAFGMLSRAYMRQFYKLYAPTLPEAEKAARRALEVDETISSAHAFLGGII
ncbi:MAG: adenylate/guanylate cyclase domain-containing protein, partial [Planctomycetota bacterium]